MKKPQEVHIGHASKRCVGTISNENQEAGNADTAFETLFIIMLIGVHKYLVKSFNTTIFN